MDEFFENERTFLIDYYNHIKSATYKSDKMTQTHKSKLGLLYVKEILIVTCDFCRILILFYLFLDVADTYKKISSSLVQLATIDGSELEKYVFCFFIGQNFLNVKICKWVSPF